MSKADRELKKLGFELVGESNYGLCYRRKVNWLGEYFTQIVDICWQSSGEHFLRMFNLENPASINGGLTLREMKWFYKKFEDWSKTQNS